MLPTQRTRISTQDLPTPKHHPIVRLVLAPGNQGALLYFRVHGREPLSAHQESQREAACWGFGREHLQTGRRRAATHSRFGLLSSGYEAGELVGHDDRTGGLLSNFTSGRFASHRPSGEGRHGYRQASRFWAREGSQLDATLHRIRLHTVVPRSRSLAALDQLQQAGGHVGPGNDLGGAGQFEAHFPGSDRDGSGAEDRGYFGQPDYEWRVRC